MSRFHVEVPPNPHPFRANPEPAHVEQALARLIPIPAALSVIGNDDGALAITADINVIGSIEHHQSAANAVLSAVNQLGLYAVRLVATRTATWAAEAAISSALGGFGLGASQKSELAPFIAVAAGLFGGFIGSQVERELEMFEWHRDADGRWSDAGRQRPNLGWGWQPS